MAIICLNGLNIIKICMAFKFKACLVEINDANVTIREDFCTVYTK